MKLQLKFGLILSTISILSYVSFANAETKVIASIKPLHSLVSYVIDGVGKPGILVDGSSSPHTFQLKPSHAEMLQEADIVFLDRRGLRVIFRVSFRINSYKLKAHSFDGGG